MNSTDFPFRTANKGFDPKTQAIQRIKDGDVVASTWPPEAVVVERLENSDFYGVFAEVQAPRSGRAGRRRRDRAVARRPAGNRRPPRGGTRSAAAADRRHQRPARCGAKCPTCARFTRRRRSSRPKTPDQEKLAVVSGKIAELQAELARWTRRAGTAWPNGPTWRPDCGRTWPSSMTAKASRGPLP